MSGPTYQSRFAPKAGEKLTLASSLPLPNGLTMPRFGIGTWEMSGRETVDALRHAVESVGYRNIDTAQYYRNEGEVGAYVNSCPVPRNELYVITKTFSKGSNARSSIEQSLRKSGLEYWDCVLIHAPDGGRQSRLQTWQSLSELVHEGKVRSLGVSNYGEHHMKELMDSKPDVLPVTNQIECHPFFPQVSLRKCCEEYGVPVQSYCPLARGRYFSNKTLRAIAEAYGKTPAQIMLRWEIQSGMIPLPKSSNAKRQEENADALIGGWELNAEDMARLDAVGSEKGSSGAVEIQTMSQDAP